MTKPKFNPEDMPIIDVDMSRCSPYETWQFLKSPEIISVYLAERAKAPNPQVLKKALEQVAKAEAALAAKEKLRA